MPAALPLSVLHTDYMFPGINGVKNGPLSFLGHRSVFPGSWSLHRPSSVLIKLQATICSPQGELSGAINAASPTIKQWLNGFPCGQTGIWTVDMKRAHIPNTRYNNKQMDQGEFISIVAEIATFLDELLELLVTKAPTQVI